jgi:HAD superfamily hydrolase (TIGR01509 family)
VCRVGILCVVPGAVILDLDGVLLDSEQRWNEAREALVRDAGGTWAREAPRVMMGMSSPEWSAYLRDELGVPLDAEAISRDVVRRMEDGYRRELPLLPGAVEAVRRLAGRWRLGLASSSNRPIIDLVLELAGIDELFEATVSSEEVDRGKPAPDVYLEAARRLRVEPRRSAAIEDSTNGLLAARAAGLAVVAIPNHAFPPGPEALEAAEVVLDSLDALSPAVIDDVVSRA